MGKPAVRIVLDAPNRKAVYAAIGVKSGSVLPPGLSGWFHNVTLYGRRGEPLPIPPVTVCVSPTYGSGSTHRIRVECPHCGLLTPFGRLHMHYTTVKCDSFAAIRAASPLFDTAPSPAYAGKVPCGYAVLQLCFVGWELQPFTLQGKPKRMLRGLWTESARFSMLATQPTAFFDWIMERTSDVPERFHTSEAYNTLEMFAASFRVVTREELRSLTEWYGIPFPAGESDELPHDSRERKRQERKEQREAARLNAERLKYQFPWLASD